MDVNVKEKYTKTKKDKKETSENKRNDTATDKHTEEMHRKDIHKQPKPVDKWAQ